MYTYIEQIKCIMEMKIKYVDGFEVRRTIMPEFHYNGLGGVDYGNEYIPSGEVWVEKTFRDETDFILRTNNLFLKLMKTMSYQEARSYINRHHLLKTRRNPRLRSAKIYVQKWIRQIVKTPEAKKFLLMDGITKLKIYFVDGKAVRTSCDVLFIYGGHHYVYPYIPKNEIWLDVKHDKRELKYTFFHELYEYQLMRKGMDYDSAHDFAIAFEKYLKRKDGVANYRFDADENKSRD